MTRNTLLSFALAILVAPTPALAGPVSGSGIVEGKDVAQRLVQIDGELFVLSPTARLRWAEGGALTLGALEVPTIPPAASGLYMLLRATYSGQSAASGPAVIHELVLTPADE